MWDRGKKNHQFGSCCVFLRLPKSKEDKTWNQQRAAIICICIILFFFISIRRNFPVARSIRERRRAICFQSNRRRRDDQVRPFRTLWLFYAKQPENKEIDRLVR